MSHAPIQVGRPLESARSSRRRRALKTGLRESARPSARGLSNLRASNQRLSKGKLAEAGAPARFEDEIIPVVQPLPLLPVRHFLLLSALLAISVLLVWGLVRANHLSVALSYEISSLNDLKTKLSEENRRLKTELAEAGSLERLEEAARRRLGLITPNQGQIVVIE